MEAEAEVDLVLQVAASASASALPPLLFSGFGSEAGGDGWIMDRGPPGKGRVTWSGRLPRCVCTCVGVAMCLHNPRRILTARMVSTRRDTDTPGVTWSATSAQVVGRPV